MCSQKVTPWGSMLTDRDVDSASNQNFELSKAEAGDLGKTEWRTRDGYKAFL